MMTTIESVQQSIQEHFVENRLRYIKTSHAIHENPEIGNEEVFASLTLTTLLKEAGFTVKEDIAGHPTGFVAEKRIGEGPTIAFLAEYDALPGLGHACGHNIIGTTSVAAGIALAEQLDHIGGRVVVLGTPAEEGGTNGSAKGSFVREGYLEGIDAALIIHPANETRPSGSSLAVDPVDYVFRGVSAHASGSPEKGVNALDAVIQLFNGINALRQHLTDDVRIHGIIPDGGDAPNIVPDYARARFYIRADSRPKANDVRAKVDAIAQGAALATGAKVEIVEFQNKVDNLIPNDTLNDVFNETFATLGETIIPGEREGLGSTDTGNISQVVPTIHPYIKIGSSELVAHTVPFREAAASQKGDEALLTGAKGLALIGYRLLKEPAIIDEAKKELESRKSLAEKR